MTLKMKIGQKEFIFLGLNKIQDGREGEDCYKKLRTILSTKEADRKVSKVSSYCADCENRSAL